MPTINGRLDDLGFPVIELSFVGGNSPLTAVLDTAPLVVDWFGERRSVRADLVPAIRPASARPLIGCRLLRDSRLEIDSPRGTVLVSRA